MAEAQENYIESSYMQDIQKELNDIPSAKVHDVYFSNALSMINTIKNFSSEMYFNTLISWKINFDWLKKNEKRNIQSYTIQYIQDKQNKANVLDNYLKYDSNIPDWIKETIEKTYHHEEIWEYELEWYFKAHDIITFGKEINGENWDGSNIEQDNPNMYKICTWSFFSEEQFITKFNKLNENRILENQNIMGKVNFDNFDISWNIENLGIRKRKNNFYIWDQPLSSDLLLSKQCILDYIRNSSNFNYVTEDEFQNDLKNNKIINHFKQEIPKFESKLKNFWLKDEDENYNFHESGLQFYKEYKLASKKDILNAFEKWNYGKLGKINHHILENIKHYKLWEIMNLLEIQEDDIPDLREQKARLIYLLNHGLFRSFQLEIWAIDSNLSMFNDTATLWEKTLTALQEKIKWYKSEKSPEFFQLLEDINNIKIDIDWALKDPYIKEELNSYERIWNVTYVINMFKSIFIHRLKNGDCDYKNFKNIDTFKHQIAYILATLHHESRYQHDAHRKESSFYWFGQINGEYTSFWTNFIQQSWIQFENRNSKDINFIWQPEGFLDREISKFTFVYGLSYWLFSSGWNLDKYINDEKKDYEGARKIEAGDFAQKYVDAAKIWENYIK